MLNLPPVPACQLDCQVTPANDHLTCGETPASTLSRSGARVSFPPGLEPPPETPSHGSALHTVGDCRPCAWFWKPSGCVNGKECLHCHSCPESAVKHRKKEKSTYMRLGLVTPKFAASEEAADVLAASMALTKTATETEMQHDELEESTSAPSSDPECSDASLSSPRQVLQLSPAVLPVPAAPSAGFVQEPSSVGSALHAWGACEPCAWFWKPKGCLNGAECQRCHDCPPGETLTRKKTKKAMMRLGLVTPKASLAEPMMQNPFVVGMGSS
eukprot:TRINITY_DN884_c0_g1_i2.p1 TRINITY_DN884_c0_g1~~TRINITY_DN884_c0_g1_i2.p1  ORF type:complete len:271 (+),score=39.74 TRINITY_DN884_c0_g1_i2:295-1107(+)